MKDSWAVFRGEQILPGDICQADLYGVGSLYRFEVCGLKQKGVWNVIDLHSGNSLTVNEKDIKLINRNINYLNIRISGCRKNIKALKQYEMELEAKKIEMMRKEGVDENDKRYRITF